MKCFIAVTGASGTIYAVRLLQKLIRFGVDIETVFSQYGKIVAENELGWSFPEQISQWPSYLTRMLGFDNKNNACTSTLKCYAENDMLAPPASGSHIVDAMIVIPASMGVISAIATGASQNLLERAADVMIKEHRQLIVVPRETPMSTIHLKHLYELSTFGVQVLPACPSFYQKPETISDLVEFLVQRILDQLKLADENQYRWGKDNK